MTMNYKTILRVLNSAGFVSLIISLFFVQVVFYNEHDMRALLAQNDGALAMFFSLFGCLCFTAGGLYNHVNVRLLETERKVQRVLDNAIEELNQIKKQQ